MFYKLSAFLSFIFIFQLSFAQNSLQLVEYNEVTSGAERTDKYLPLLHNKKVALVANQSSIIGDTHLADSLISTGVNIVKIFCPEHGFRGTADAGAIIKDGIDVKTGIPIISLYGSHKKPTPEDLWDVDVVVFDLQDVGTRYYTYISTLTYVMEACAENNVPLIVLDRPNPNGFYIDGPILEPENRSFVGLHPIPIVYGMTIGEYAHMVAGEKWIVDAEHLSFKVIELENYNHNMIVKLRVKPSPNLPNWKAVYLYPSLCLFEGTIMSVGRGTDFPFQVYGHPYFMVGSYVFTPKSNEGASNPKYMGQHCYGSFLQRVADNYERNPKKLTLNWLLGSYEIMHDSSDFFNSYFVKLAGTGDLQKQIESGLSEQEIRQTWEPGLNKFKQTRSKYLLYD